MNNLRQRMEELSGKAEQLMFTDIQRALKYLSEVFILLKENADPDLELKYYLYSAIVENQLYNYKLSENHFVKAIDIINDRGDITQVAETFIDFTGTLLNLEKVEEVRSYLSESAGLLRTFQVERLFPRLICREGYLHLKNSNYTRALESFLEAERRMDQLESRLLLKDYHFITLIKSGLGSIYAHNREFDKSISAYIQVVLLCEEKGMKSRLSWHYLNVGNTYMALQDDDSAISYFKDAIRMVDDVNQQARAFAFANLGYCYSRKGHYKEALTLMSKAYPLFREKRDKNLANIEWWKAKIFEEQGKRKKSIATFYTALEYAKKAEDYRQIAGIIKDISDWFAKDLDFKNAYDFQKLYENALERYLSEVKTSELRELEVKYEADKKEKEAEMFKLQATGLQLKALRAQMNPHFVFNALNSVQHYITSNNSVLASKYLAQFAQLMRRSLEYSDKEVISLEEEIEFLDNYLEINEKLRFENKMQYVIEVDEEIEEDIYGVPTMIIQPYVENAIEHGIRSKKSGLVKVKFQLSNDDTIICIIEDDGVGREKARQLQENNPKSKNHKSLGTKITQERLEILLRSKKRMEEPVVVEDLKDEKTGEAIGTRVKILIPILEIQMK